MGAIKRYLPIIYKLFPFLVLLFFVFSFLYRSDPSFDQDLGRHLKLGEIIWNTKQIPSVNLFSYTNPNSLFINHHWLFEVLAYLGSISIGVEAMLVIKVVLLLFCVTLVLLLAGKSKSALLLPVSFVFLHLLRERTDLRPELLSFLFTVLELYILEKFDESDSKLIYLLPIISLIWVNSHIYFPVGIFLQFIFLGDLLLKKFILKKEHLVDIKKFRTLILVVASSVLVTLINPHFITGAFYPFTVLNDLGVTTTENQSVFTLENSQFKDPNFLFYYLSAGLVLVALFISFFKSKLTFKDFCLAFLGLALASQTIREFPFLVFISLPAVLRCFDFDKSFWWTKALNTLVICLVVVEAIFYLNGSYYRLTYQDYSPKLIAKEDANGAMDFVLQKNLPQPIFNNFDIGSYIIYRGYPQYQVFVDGRPEAYPANFFQNVYNPMQEDYSKFQTEAKKYDFKTVIFSITDQNPRTLNFLNKITRDPNWQTVYLDYFMIVLVRSDYQKELHLPAVNLDKLNVNDFSYSYYVDYTNLSALLFNTQRLEEARNFNQKALDLAPDNPAANFIMANILLHLDQANVTRISPYLDRSTNAVFW